MTQFVYKDKYIQFRGYIFANGNPVPIKDEATDRILRSHPDFKIFEPKVEPVQVLEEAKIVVEAPKQEPVYQPKKLGRPFKGR